MEFFFLFDYLITSGTVSNWYLQDNFITKTCEKVAVVLVWIGDPDRCDFLADTFL